MLKLSKCCITSLVLYFIVGVSSLHACALCGSNKVSLITASTHTIFTNNAVEKIEVTWKFDETFSAQLASLYDKNKDSQFDTEETNAIFHILSSVEKPPFMSVVYINGTEIKAFKIEYFKASMAENIVYFSFDIVLNYPINSSMQLFFYFFDPTQSLAFFHTADETRFSNTTPFTLHKKAGFKVLPNTMSIVNAITYEVEP